MTLPASLVLAQDTAAVVTSEPTAQAAPAPAAPPPSFAYGVSQILQLSQAKVPDDTIVAYIKGSGSSYGLTADQIIYLQQEGVSSTVINAMLTQPRPGAMTYAPAPVVNTPATPAPVPAYGYGEPQQDVSAGAVTPPVTAIDPGYSAYYYSSYPAYYSYPYYYPGYGYYGCYPGVSFSVGWGRGYWGGYGWRGGWHGSDFHGGFHPSGSFHGGFSGGFHSSGGFGGGFHGGGGFHH